MTEGNEKETTVTQAVTDGTLDSPGNEEIKEQIHETKEDLRQAKEDLKRDDIDQRERSNLGRKVKRLEDELSEMKNLLIEIKSQREPQTQVSDEPEYISTPEDARKVYSRMRRDEFEATRKYEKLYMDNLRNIADPEIHDEVVEEMMKNYNVKRGDPYDPKTWNPMIDSELNYTNAKMAILSRKLGKVKPNVRGERQTAPTNLSVSSRSDHSSPANIELDEIAAEYVRRRGLKEDTVRDALKSEVPHGARR